MSCVEDVRYEIVARHMGLSFIDLMCIVILSIDLLIFDRDRDMSGHQGSFLPSARWNGCSSASGSFQDSISGATCHPMSAVMLLVARSYTTLEATNLNGSLAPSGGCGGAAKYDGGRPHHSTD